MSLEKAFKDIIDRTSEEISKLYEHINAQQGGGFQGTIIYGGRADNSAPQRLVVGGQAASSYAPTEVVSGGVAGSSYPTFNHLDFGRADTFFGE